MTDERIATESEEISLDELASLNEGRATIYGLLARLFRVEVDQPFLDQLHAMRFPAETGSEQMDAGYRRLANYLGQTGPSTLTELAIDYVRVFIGHGIDSCSAAYPFESVYTSPERLMMQQSRDEVLAIYRSEHMEKSADWRDSEDHIALELEFMGTMASRAAVACREGNADEADRLTGVQRSFVQDHLQTWIPSFAKDMRRFAQTDLYLALADLLEGFVDLDEEFLGE